MKTLLIALMAGTLALTAYAQSPPLVKRPAGPVTPLPASNPDPASYANFINQKPSTVTCTLRPMGSRQKQTAEQQREWEQKEQECIAKRDGTAPPKADAAAPAATTPGAVSNSNGPVWNNPVTRTNTTLPVGWAPGAAAQGQDGSPMYQFIHKSGRATIAMYHEEFPRPVTFDEYVQALFTMSPNWKTDLKNQRIDSKTQQLTGTLFTEERGKKVQVDMRFWMEGQKDAWRTLVLTESADTKAKGETDAITAETAIRLSANRSSNSSNTTTTAATTTTARPAGDSRLPGESCKACLDRLTREAGASAMKMKVVDRFRATCGCPAVSHYQDWSY